MRNIKENKAFKAFIIAVMAIMLLSCLPIKAYAASEAEIAPFGFFQPNPFTFYGSHAGSSRYYDGNYMAVEIMATGENGAVIPMTLRVYVPVTDKYHYFTFNTDGTWRKYDYIYLGANGGSNGSMRYDSSNASIGVTVTIRSYSWTQ